MFEEPFLMFAGRLRQKGEVDLLRVSSIRRTLLLPEGRRTYSVDPVHSGNANQPILLKLDYR